MKRIRIVHKTEYHYHQPVTFGSHRLMMRPREGHDVHIVTGRLDIQPSATVRWLRDIYGNSIAVLTFGEPSRKLSILGEVEVELRNDNPMTCLIDPDASQFPFQYAPEEQVDLIHYRLPSYPYEGPKLRHWLGNLYRPGKTIGTFDLLEKLNTQIYRSFAYQHRDDPGVRLPCDTLTRKSGSCRDFAVFMMEAARHWGIGARFVSGYIQMEEGQHGATHAWTEIYIPGAGWCGFDPTNNKLAGNEHISVAVAREQEKACPVSRAWEGPANAFSNMEVSVQVVPLREWRCQSLSGQLGIVGEGALAGLLLVDDNPPENIKLVEDLDRNFLVIVKDGTVYKDTVPK